jgi:hypothetical protein
MIKRPLAVTKFLHLSALLWGKPRVISEEQQRVLRKGNTSQHHYENIKNRYARFPVSPVLHG